MPMNESPVNEALDRLFRHMAWANQLLLTNLQEIPAEFYSLTAENDEWTVGMIAKHLVQSAGFYVSRISGDEAPQGLSVPIDQNEIATLAVLSTRFDARLRELSLEPEGMTTYVREGETITRARSTILGQSIHHATEHRAQIADILSLHKIKINGMKAVDLDDMDVWAYGDFEGLGK